eukprot:CAMPEP_0184868158 /NCGR_PEP_ID=MMETSP0580-20130426/29391_1 /TAXON_ID=1118495 /ORGANISM="Dactyliosolen fragilissimus" /LENGTH=176 /DNA_ID=CAMNT_0027368863 /DNA_START=61 /DNA_END=588 /DNA_ORIENTATION=-
MPPMEFDTNAFWIDAEAMTLNDVMIDYDAGVHALSHAILAVAPLFVPCAHSDLDCDHSRKGCTRVLIFDSRAGGVGTSSRLWEHIFREGGLLEAAIELLEECPSFCHEVSTSSYGGGCPGCIQSVPCLNFQEDLSRKGGLIIGKRMLERIRRTSHYKQNMKEMNDSTSSRVGPKSP